MPSSSRRPLYSDLADVDPSDILRWSPKLREAFNARYRIAHPENPDIDRLTHVLWTGRAQSAEGTARNAVFYGDKAIDRSPCGTGTSARMAHLAARGDLKEGDAFVHESIIGSTFVGRIEGRAKVGDRDAIIPSIEGWARVTGFNTIVIDDRDPFATDSRSWIEARAPNVSPRGGRFETVLYTLALPEQDARCGSRLSEQES